jgi:ATP-dependent helicase/nuclease subunit B
MRSLDQRRLFTVAPGVPFLKAVAEALCDGRLVETYRFDRSDPLSLARVTIYVPTRRAARALRSEFVDHVGAGSIILPVIRPLGESDDDSGFFDEMPLETLDLLPPVDKVDTLLELASLIRRWKDALPEAVSGFHQGSPLIAPASPADAVWLARGLSDLLDAMETFGVSWKSLELLEASDHAEWWQLTLEFLKIASSFWPARLAELSRSSSAAHRNALLAAETERLAGSAPRGPIVVAGSTGSLPATADLMAAIARLEDGAIVLPGVDLDMPSEIWSMLAGSRVEPPHRLEPAVLSHPQYGLHALLDKLGAPRDDVRRLEDLASAGDAGAIGDRNAVVAAALLPARATARWAKASLPAEATSHALDGVSLIEAGGEREEAAAIAVAMRMAANDPASRVALVTPDRNLARRVSTELHRFGIEANDSGGVPLSSTAPATLMRLLLDAVMQPGDPIALTGLLSHPLSRFGYSAEESRRAARILELVALRGTIGEVDVAALTELFETARVRHAQDRHAPQWRRRLTTAEIEDAQRLAAIVERTVAPLAGRFVRFGSADDAGSAERLGSRFPVSDWARETALVLEEVARDPETGLAGLWSEEAGEALSALLSGVIASNARLSATGAEWADIVEALLAGETVKPRLSVHPRIFIWGTLEARLQDVDTIVLAGLNEGGWPSRIANDPFLSRAMKTEIGLDPPERRIGLAAHDFQMAMGTPKVVLSRASRADKAPTIASRWLQRLLVVAGPQAADAMRARGEAFLRAAAALDVQPPRPLASRPEPRPAAEIQPKRYSFSEVRTLRRDPYAIYARRVLRLDPLDPLIRDPGVAERGTLYHAILERFTRSGIAPGSDAAYCELEKICDQLFADERLPMHVEALWRPRFDRIATLFIDWERARDGDVVRRYTELRGQADIGLSGVVLSGKADRIDLLHSGGAEIIDYKTGMLPSRSQARALLDPQLPLEAAALMAGGFADLGPLSPHSLKYVRLRGDATLAVDALEGKGRGADDVYRSAEDLGREAIARLEGFVSLLASRRRGFISRLVPASARDYGGEYDHLARVAEWASSESDDILDDGASS